MDSAFLSFAFEGERARWANGLCGFAVESRRVSKGLSGRTADGYRRGGKATAGLSNGAAMCYNGGKRYIRGAMKNEDFKGGRADVV